MSITLNLEAAKGMSIYDVKRALSVIDNTEIDENDTTLSAFLSDSNVSLTVKTELDDTSILTEDMDSVDWEVGLRIYFDIDPTRANTLDDIKKFISELAKVSSAYFVLSFGYETLYAKKDMKGLVLTEAF